MDDTAVHTAGRRRLDLKEAAAELGVTSEAIRRRAKRGTLPSEKGEDGAGCTCGCPTCLPGHKMYLTPGYTPCLTMGYTA